MIITLKNQTFKINLRKNKKKKTKILITGNRDNRDSPSIEAISAPTSPTNNGQINDTQSSSTNQQQQIGRNPLRGSKCKFFFFV